MAEVTSSFPSNVSTVSECSILVELLIGCHDVASIGRRLDDGSTEDATGKVATIGDEVDVGIKTSLHLLQRLAYLCDMLVAECFVDAQVVVAP